MKNLKAVASLIVLVLLCLMQLAAAQSSPRTKTGSAQASLDLLVSRIDNYWKLLLERKKLQAAEYVAPSDRERFVNRQIPSFSEPRLKSVEFSTDDRTTAQVVVTVKRILPVGPVEWPVGGQWVFDTDNWYLRVPLSSPPMFSELLQRSQVPLDANQIEAVKRELKNMLRFEKSALDFGTVRQGRQLSLSLKYTLIGDEPVRIGIKDAPPGIKMQGMKEQSLIPGKLQELSILAPTSDYDGAVNERVVLAAYRYGVEVPFEFSLQGFVYTPVSVIPKGLRFIWAKGEREKEFSVRNNSKSTLELKSLIGKTNLIAVEPLPATIQPGQQLAMKVRQVGDVQQRNVIQDLEIVFSKPVDDMESLRLAVLLNAVEEMPRNIDEAPAVTPQVQELIRKNQVILPKR